MYLYKVTSCLDGSTTFAKDRPEVKRITESCEPSMTKLFKDLEVNKYSVLKDFIVQRVELNDTILEIATREEPVWRDADGKVID